MRLPKTKPTRPGGPTLLELNRAAIDDQLEKGQIDQEQAKKMRDNLQKQAMAQLIAMKGGKRPKTRGQKRKTLLQRREEWQAQQERRAAEQISTASLGEIDPDSTSVPPQRIYGKRGQTEDVVMVDEAAFVEPVPMAVDPMALSDPSV